MATGPKSPEQDLQIKPSLWKRGADVLGGVLCCNHSVISPLSTSEFETNAKEINVQPPFAVFDSPSVSKSRHGQDSEPFCQAKQHLNYTNFMFKGWSRPEETQDYIFPALLVGLELIPPQFGERKGWQGNFFASTETLNLGFLVLSSLDLNPQHLWIFWESGKRHLFTIGLLETAEGWFPGMMEKASLWISGWSASI